MRRVGLIPALLVAAVAAGCGSHAPARAGTPKYLDPGTSRPAVVAALDRTLCSGHIPVIEDAAPYWVGECRDRTTFEKPVFIMVFDSAAEMRDYLARFESCRPEATYERGPRWFAMTVADGDATTLEHAGATRFTCK